MIQTNEFFKIYKAIDKQSSVFCFVIQLNTKDCVFLAIDVTNHIVGILTT